MLEDLWDDAPMWFGIADAEREEREENEPDYTQISDYDYVPEEEDDWTRQ